MIPYQLGLLILVSTIIIVITYPIEALVSKNCTHTCGAKTLAHPLGFSPGCPIHLHCDSTNSTGVAKIGEFLIINATADSILVGFPTECNRSLNTMKDLFGGNYAPTWKNTFFLQNCSNLSNSCVISEDLLAKQFNLHTCDIQGNINCILPDNSTNTRDDFMSYDEINRSQCEFSLSAIAVDNSSKNSSVLVEFERVELAWWLPGGCVNNSCHMNGDCKAVKLGNGELGHSCRCGEGYDGDGFVDGQGCLRVVSDCNSSKIFGCAGTKVGVLVGGIVAGAALVCTLVLICYCLQQRSASLKSMISARHLLTEVVGNSTVLFYHYKEIDKATNGFAEAQMLGTGAYGTVYAGKLNNDEWVAIKRLKHKDTDSVDQVLNEIKLLSSVSHPNLVRLLGCCLEEGEPILVYEFMPNGTLSQHLQMERGPGLPWTTRLTIATQTAKAIAYLHSSINPPIYHRDIKSSNILLDYNYNSKVADFGLSRLGINESSHISTTPQGTPGYLDPQYHQYFQLSDKSDVYSFGVLLVEIITALKVVDFSRPKGEVNLAALAIERIGRGGLDEIIDPLIESDRDAWTLSSIHNIAELAFRCLAFHGDMRPTMKEVAEELDQIRLSAWVPNVYPPSPSVSICSSDNGSEASIGGVSMAGKQTSIGSRRMKVSRKTADCLTPLDEIKDNSPISVQEIWLSAQSSPSTNSLLGIAPK